MDIKKISHPLPVHSSHEDGIQQKVLNMTRRHFRTLIQLLNYFSTSFRNIFCQKKPKKDVSKKGNLDVHLRFPTKKDLNFFTCILS